MKTALSFLFAFSCVFSFCAAETLYVSPHGSDSNPGTEAKPFLTIQRAQKEVRKKTSAGLQEPVAVFLREGIYRITEPLVFGPRDGGTKEFSVTYAAYKGEEPVISGGRVIKGWEKKTDGTWETEIPAVKNGAWRFRSLFVDGKRAARCREPDEGYYRVKKAGSDKRTGFFFHREDLSSLSSLAGVELVFLHDWSITRVPVKSVDRERGILTVKHQIGGSSRWSRMDWFEKHPRYCLENSQVFLDSPGEWYLDVSSGVLAYKPEENENINKTTFVAPVASQLIAVRGDPETGRFVRNLHFRGLACIYTSWSPPDGVYWGRQACTYWTFKTKQQKKRHEKADPAACQFELADSCSFYRGAIGHTGASGIWLGRSCRNCRVEESKVIDTGGNGIMVGEGQIRVSEGGPWWKTAPEQAATNNTISGNLVSHCGRILWGAVGIWSGLAAKTVIEGNEVKNLPYTGISIGWMWWNPRSRAKPRPTPCKQTRVEDNHIHHCMQILSDGGGIYSLGVQPGSFIRGNVIHDIPLNAGRAESNGMFLDQGTGDFVIEKNVIYDVERSPLRFHKGWKNIVRDNVLEVTQGLPTVRYNDTRKERIVLKENKVFKKVPPRIIQKALKRLKDKASPRS